MARRVLLLPAVVVLAVAACGDGAAVEVAATEPAGTAPTEVTATRPEREPTTAAIGAEREPTDAATGAVPGPSRPEWLGTRPLPLRADGFGEVLDTPAELRDRRLPPPRTPLDGAGDATPAPAAVGPVPDGVAARSTWSTACPVALEDLRYVTLDFWGFDGLVHRGELLVHADAATDVVAVFARLFEARFPIEEMRVVAPAELDAEPTGDGNNTTAFVCRPVRGASSWSEHAYGRAVDVNPFHNPYVRGDLVLPELASAYVDRTWRRPGMVAPGDPVTTAFAAAGWGWGGDWQSPDWMHFSMTGR